MRAREHYFQMQTTLSNPLAKYHSAEMMFAHIIH